MLDDAEHLQEHHDADDQDDGNNDTTSVHLYSCIYCATGLHGQCRGTEKYQGGLIRCECYDAGHGDDAMAD